MRGLIQSLAFCGGLLALVAVLVPPLAADARILFAAHMIQHLLVIAVAAPLLVLGGVHLRTRPVWAWIAFVGVFLFWHWNVAFRWAALQSGGELIELGSILATALLFWTAALAPGRLSDGARALLVMTAAVVTDLPGVIMLFAPTVICAMPAENAARFGIAPITDQQIAGLLMWVPANLVFFAIATFLFARWMSEPRDTPSTLVTS